jgi:beta-lactamase class C
MAPVMDQALSKDAMPASAADIKQAVEQVMHEYNVPGMAIAITNHGQQTFYNFGVASKATRKAVSSDTIFEIGSLSKTFTVTLATYAQVLGRLSLNDSPAKFLPELRNSNLDKVSLINLGTHTAGGFPLQVPDEITNRKQLMAYFKAWTPQYVAGSARTYANPSIGLLGMVAAKAMDQPYKMAVQSQLFAKLGLHDSYFDVPHAKMANYAQGYNKADVPVRVNPGELADEAYGIKTTARDLIHFVATNIDSSNVDDKIRSALSATRVRYYKLGAMTQDLIWEQYDEPVQLNDLLDGNSNKVALQTNPVQAIVPPCQPAQAIWVNKTGSTNGFGAYVAFVPDQQVGIVILANKNFPIEARVRLAYLILGR